MRARKEAEAGAGAIGGEEELGEDDHGEVVPSAPKAGGGDTHAADMRRQMLKARAEGAAKKAKLAQVLKNKIHYFKCKIPSF